MDSVSKETRSSNMRAIRSKNTLPEITIRKMVFSLGYRYRLHGNNLPGKPDLVFHARKKVIFVNGCFWHQHEGCKRSKLPKSNLDYWIPKLERNKLRDQASIFKLSELGWKSLIIWECEIKDIQRLTEKVEAFLGQDLR